MHAATAVPAHSAVFSRFVLPEATGAAAVVERGTASLAIHSTSSQTSLAACHLFSGSLARHFLTTRSSAGGVMGWSDDIGGGSVSRIFAIRLA